MTACAAAYWSNCAIEYQNGHTSYEEWAHFLVFKKVGGGASGKFVVANQKIAGRRKHIVFAFKNKVQSEQEDVLSNKFLLCIQMIYNLGLLFLKSIIHTLFWANFFGI